MGKFADQLDAAKAAQQAAREDAAARREAAAREAEAAKQLALEPIKAIVLPMLEAAQLDL